MNVMKYNRRRVKELKEQIRNHIALEELKRESEIKEYLQKATPEEEERFWKEYAERKRKELDELEAKLTPVERYKDKKTYRVK